jgi:hypothetical protein
MTVADERGTVPARLFAVLAVLVAVALFQGALCGDAAASPCGLTSSVSASPEPAVDCGSGVSFDAPPASRGLDGVADLCVALVAVLLTVVVALRLPRALMPPPRHLVLRSPRTATANVSPFEQLCVRRT